MKPNDDHPEPAGDGAADSDDVGYCKPPKHTQFRPGNSGNPRGRRKGVRNLKTDVKRILNIPVKIKQHGRSRRISTQAGVLMVLREKALGGDARALDHLLELASRFNDEPNDAGPAPALSASDQAILDAFRAEITSSPEKWPTAEPLTHEAATPREDKESTS